MRIELIEKKLRRFVNSLRKHRSVIFCVRCGSTHVDGRSLARLDCDSCGNSVAWDGLSFGLATVRPPKRASDVVVSDAEEAFALRETTPPWLEAGQAPIAREKSSAVQE